MSSDAIGHLVELLRAATSARDTSRQAQISQALDEFGRLPDADRHLLQVLTGGNTYDGAIRGLAGLILKNMYKKRKVIPESSLEFIKGHGRDPATGQSALLRTLGDATVLVRGTVGTLISAIVLRLGRKLGLFWPDILGDLVKLCHVQIGAAELETKQGEAASDTILKICEDCSDELEFDTTRPLEFLSGELLKIASSSPNNTIICNVLRSANNLIYADGALDGHVTALLHILSLHAGQTKSAPVKRVICQSLSMLLDVYADDVKPMEESIMEYMLENMKLPSSSAAHDEEGERVALEACEFCHAWVEKDPSGPVLSKFLPRLVPTLMRNMVYAEDDPDLEEEQEEERMIGSAKQAINTGIKPRHYKQRNEDDDGSSSDSDGDGKDMSQELWTLRKCSAATLDLLSHTAVEEELTPLVLDIVGKSINMNGDWRFQEMAILTLGAVSEGCIESVSPHLPTIVGVLLEKLQSPMPLVRAITAWTLSRYAGWMETRGDARANEMVVKSLVHGLADPVMRVQQAACSALCVFMEKAKGVFVGGDMVGLLSEGICFGLERYGPKNLIVLYDMIGTFADQLLGEIAEEQRPQVLAFLKSIMPILLHRWSTNLDSYSLFALLECVCSMSIAAGSVMEEFADRLFLLSMTMMEAVMGLLRANHGRDDNDDSEATIEYEYMIIGMDLVGGLVQGLGEKMLPSIASSVLIEVLKAMVTCEMPPVRQAVFALVGDMSPQCSEGVKALIAEPLFSAALLEDLDARAENTSQSCAQNAAWCYGELLTGCGEELMASGMVKSCVPHLCTFLGYSEFVVNRGYLENTAMALSRSVALAGVLGEEVLRVLVKWTHVVNRIGEEKEREAAWLPMLSVLMRGGGDCLRRLDGAALKGLLLAMYSCQRPSEQLHYAFCSVIGMIRERLLGGLLSEQWEQFKRVSGLPEDFDVRFS